MQEKYITSRQNPLMQHIKRLQRSKAYRTQSGQFTADGVKLLREAIAWCGGLRTVVCTADAELPPLPAHVQKLTVPPELMQWLSQMQTPQGVLFLCDLPDAPELRLAPGCLILDGIQDPGNLGTILRTADALEVPVVLSDGCADPYGEKTLRASMGAVFRSPVCTAPAEEILALCRQTQIPLAVTAMSPSALDIRRADPAQYAVVIGSEGQGVGAKYLQAAQTELVIPMSSRCESLNAAVAATIVMWQMRR